MQRQKTVVITVVNIHPGGVVCEYPIPCPLNALSRMSASRSTGHSHGSGDGRPGHCYRQPLRRGGGVPRSQGYGRFRPRCSDHCRWPLSLHDTQSLARSESSRSPRVPAAARSPRWERGATRGGRTGQASEPARKNVTWIRGPAPGRLKGVVHSPPHHSARATAQCIPCLLIVLPFMVFTSCAGSCSAR